MASLKKSLKRAYLVINRKRTEQNCSEWLSDNFYIIDRYYRIALKDKNTLKLISFFRLLKTHCEDNDYNLKPETLLKYLTFYAENANHRELSAAKTLLAVCAITKIAEQTTQKTNGFMLSNAVKLLFALSEPEFDDIIPKVWKPERLLESFEPCYILSDKATKSQYRAFIAEYAHKNAINEYIAAEQLIKKAETENKLIGNYVFMPKNKYRNIWLMTTSVIFILISLIGLWCVGWVSLLLTVPYVITSNALADQIISFFAPPYYAPRLEAENIPEDAKTMVTVAALLNGGEGDKKVFESLARFRYMNPDSNVYFCLLADLPDSDNRFLITDKNITESARAEIDKLNRLHGERFCMYFRERVMNKSENRYGGWERKRGAVCELVSHIVRGNGSGYYGGSFINEIKYILTLDSDTNLSVGSVNELLSVALHPVNKPTVKKNKVVSGYGIIQPTVKTELSSAYKTGFSRLITGAGGADIYATAEFTRSQSLFGLGSFCGKGLIDVPLFDLLVSEKLPEGIVLSHDVIEGSIIKTLCVSDITLTDSTPGNTVSYFKRLHRWLRGDFQNLYFIKGNLLNNFSKLRIVSTVLRHSSPIFSLAAIIWGCFLKHDTGLGLFLLAYSEFILPCALSLLRFFCSGSPFGCLRFFSKAYTVTVHSFMRLFFEISSLCRRALLTISAFVLAGTRLITKKKTLEWTTAAQTEMLNSSLGKYVLDGAASAILGLAILIFANPPFIKLSGLIFFVYPLISTVLSRALNGGAETKPDLSEKQIKLLTNHASDMFGFYNDNVGEETNYLPPDNIQFSPVAAKALRTSPTNIGFYLVSLLAARDLGIIDSETLYKRLDGSLTTIERLEKYKGNLYNWYDITNLSILGDRYISTVDCGNFMVMLTALKEGLKEYRDESPRLENIISRCEKLLSEADISFLYDKRKELFVIGYNANEDKADKSYYDLLMSEARMTAYYAVAASSVPKKHWRSLGRTLTHKNGYIGMMSWSGTAFEYLMPQLFLPLYRDSFLFESVAFSIMLQRAEAAVWGISESGFYSFDSDMNYQYKANGIQALALRRCTADEKVFSPYSSYLALCICGGAAIKNINEFENIGMYGKYGLYEALDLNSGSNLTVKSYMAHHVGMSIIACMNAIKDNIFIRRFMSDMKMASANELLQEKIPIDAHIFGEANSYEREPKKVSRIKKELTEQSDLLNPSVALLSRGEMSAIISSSGHIAINYGERLIANTVFDKNSLRFTPGITFSRNGKSFGCAPLYSQDPLNYGFEHGNGYASHIVSGKEFSGRIRYSVAKNCNCLVINTRAEALKKYDITLSFEPVLEKKKKYLSHITFSRLFIESEYDKAKRILYFHRRSGEDGRHIFSVAVAPKEKAMRFDFLSTREVFKASSISNPLDYADTVTDDKTGACIDPLCLVRSSEAEGGKATFLVTFGETKAECEQNIRLARATDRDFIPQQHNPMTEKLLPELLYGNKIKAVERFGRHNIGDLWSKGISGDYKRIVALISAPSVTRAESLINAFLELAKLCIRTELIFITDEQDNYYRPIENTLKESIKKLSASQYLRKNGGIFILRESEIEKDFKQLLIDTAGYFIDFANEYKNSLFPAIDPRPIIAAPQSASKLAVPNDCTRSNYGYFTSNGFVIDKSELPDAPYSYILTGYRFSTVVTQSSLGYSFFDNARERRLCSFYGDARSLDNGERIFAVSNGIRYDLCACASKVIYGSGEAAYYGEINGDSYCISVTVSPRFPIKLIRIRHLTPENELLFEIRPVMSDSVAQADFLETLKFTSSGNECIAFKNPFSLTFPEGFGFAGVCNGRADAEKALFSARGNEAIFFIGCCTTENGARETASRINRSFFETELKKAAEFANSFIPDMKVSTGIKETDAMFNLFLPYQVAACRFLARGSFYQSGGAYGFRDQLQDCLSLVYSNPKAVRTHIIRCCAHQYDDGTVMHWWHTRHYNGVNRGIKSKCSDDLLYLPLVTADYIEKTADDSLLDIKTVYMVSAPLGNKSERYEQPTRSEYKESVYQHCLRAFEAANKKGERGLILMGSCDWNDAFSLVGAKGRGESVFSTLLYIVSARRFLSVARARNDNETVNKLEREIAELKTAVEENAFFGDRYARAFCDDGTVLGTAECEECEIDILSQAFAAIAELEKSRTEKALATAFNKLYDRENKIFRLFAPPFANGKAEVGYIRGYAAGIRENGGQYTHGALWGALGCIKAGLYDEALLIAECVDPLRRSATRETAKKFKTEPYAVAADIYSGDHAGRGGWSWYTGAAAWYYRLLREYIFGIVIGANETVIKAEPIIEFEADLNISGMKLHISASGINKKPLLNGNEVGFPIKLTEHENTLVLPLKK